MNHDQVFFTIFHFKCCWHHPLFQQAVWSSLLSPALQVDCCNFTIKLAGTNGATFVLHHVPWRNHTHYDPNFSPQCVFSKRLVFCLLVDEMVRSHLSLCITMYVAIDNVTHANNIIIFIILNVNSVIQFQGQWQYNILLRKKSLTIKSVALKTENLITAAHIVIHE